MTTPKPLAVPTNAARLLNLLARHQGSDRGISGDLLAKQMCMEPRKLRALISTCREEGHAICGHPRSGYYVAVTEGELERCTAFLEHRAVHSLRMLARMRRVALPVLAGQLLLNQA